MLRPFTTAAPAQAVRLSARAASTCSRSSSFPSAAAAAARQAIQTRPAAAARAGTRLSALQARALSAATTRWYSSETKPAAEAETATKTEETGADPKETEKDSKPLSAEEAAALRQELETKSKEALDWKDKYLRSVADFRNLQERTQRDMKSARDFAITQFAKDLVDSVDNLDRALAMVPADKLEAAEKDPDSQVDGLTDLGGDKETVVGAVRDLANLVDGLKMTEKILLQTLQKHGLERFDPKGDKFNPNEHEATFMTPHKDHEHNTVFFTQQKGFRLNGRVLRAAKVGVVNNK